MMDKKIIDDLTMALVKLYQAHDVDAKELQEEIGYTLRLAWRTGVLDNIRDTSDQIKKAINRSES